MLLCLTTRKSEVFSDSSKDHLPDLASQSPCDPIFWHSPPTTHPASAVLAPRCAHSQLQLRSLRSSLPGQVSAGVSSPLPGRYSTVSYLVTPFLPTHLNLQSSIILFPILFAPCISIKDIICLTYLLC